MAKDDAARPAKGAARAQGRHAGLSRDRVLRAAVELIDTEGLAALSMRRLARNLEVEAMTLYHHMKNKAELEDAVIEHVLTETFDGLVADGRWQRVLTDYALALHHGLAGHPATTPLFARRPAMTSRNLAQIEKLLQVLTRAGFTPATGLTIVRATGASVLGLHLGYDADATGAGVPISGQAGTDSPSIDEDATDESADYALVSRALEEGLAGPDALVSFTVRSLIAGYERLL